MPPGPAKPRDHHQQCQVHPHNTSLLNTTPQPMTMFIFWHFSEQTAFETTELWVFLRLTRRKVGKIPLRECRHLQGWFQEADRNGESCR